MSRTVLITGAAGNIGAKITTHLREKGYDLRLLDRIAAPGVEAADFGIWDETWAARFAGVDTVIHLAGNPHGTANWESVKRDNIGATQHVLRAARNAKVRRVIFASTNQVMLGYRFKTGPVTVDMPPAPLSPYGISKFCCEEMGRAFTEETGADFLALRIGYFRKGDNLPGPDLKIGEWGQSMWLSNRDMNQAIEKAIEAPAFGFEVVYMMSHNEGMRWDLEHTRQVIGYVPLDHVKPVMLDQNRADDDAARAVRLEPGTWFDEHLHAVAP